MGRVLKPVAVGESLQWISFHTFRHTCATMLFRRGWNAVQVQKFLGHSDPGFTLRTYVHLLPEDLPEPDFAPLEVGENWATQATESTRSEWPPADENMLEMPEVPNQREAAGINS
jgi:Phage integrase family